MKQTAVRPEKTKTMDYAKDFVRYLRSHLLSVILMYAMMIVVYGSWAFQDMVTFDEEGLYLAEHAALWYEQWVSLGRFSLYFLKVIMNVYIVNPFFAIAVFLFLFPLSILLWNYCFYVWNQRKYTPVAMAVMSFAYLSHPMWATQFQYQNQIEGITVIFVLLPVAMLMLYDYLRTKRWLSLVLTVLLLIFVFGTYQSFLFLYAEVAVVMLLLMAEWAYAKQKDAWLDLLRVLVITVISFIGYEVVAKLTRMFMGSQTAYLDNQIEWLNKPFSECVHKTIAFLERLVLGRDTPVFSFLFAVEIVLFLIWGISLVVRRQQWAIYRLLLIAGWIVCPILLGVFTTGNLVNRAEFAIVFAIASGLYFFLRNIEGSHRWGRNAVAVVLVYVLCVVQLVPMTRLLYTGAETLHNDEMRMNAIYYEATRQGALPGDRIWFIGGQINDENGAYLNEEVIGISYFEIAGSAGIPQKLIQAMADYGYPVTEAQEDQIARANEMAQTMPCWPSSGSVRVEDHLIVVRLS